MDALALAPVAVTILLVLARRTSLQAALGGLSCALVLSAWKFPIPPREWGALAGHWLPILVEVLLIIGGGLALARSMDSAGRQAQVAAWLETVMGSGVGAALAIVHGVTPFAESLTGFGIGVTVAIPLLVHLGFDSYRAATIGLLGLCAVPWGSMGPGTLIAASLSHTNFQDLGVGSALASGPVFLIVGVVAAILVAAPGQRRAALLEAVCSGLLLWGCVAGANLLFGTAPAGAVGSLACLVVHLGCRRIRTSGSTPVPWRALAGHAVLLGGVLAATTVLRLVGVPSGSGWRYLASPALWLLVAVATTTPRRQFTSVLLGAGRGWCSTAPVTAAFLLLGIVMAASGMSAHVAHLAAGLGPGYVIALPFIAALGGYLTGSNSAANAMFAAPQAEAIALLGLPHLPAMATHNVASSLLLMGSPAKTELAAQLCPDLAAGRRSARTILLTDTGITACLALNLAITCHL